MCQPNIFFKSVENKFSQFKSSIVIFFILGLSFYYLLNVSWLRWGNLIVDTSRELWLPLKLLEGRVLYKDLWYPFGLLPPYFLAFLYNIFGVHVNTLVGCGISLTLITSIFIYKIARFFLDEVTSGLAVLTFLFVFAFGYYHPYSGIFNFILPYSFAATFFILFVSISLYLFLKFIFTANEKWLFPWVIFLSLGFLTRPEMSLPVWAGFVFSLALYYYKYKGLPIFKLSLYIILPLILSLSAYLLFFVKFDAFAGFKESIVDALDSGFGTRIILRASGFDNIYASLGLAVKSLLYHLVIIFSLAIGSLFLSKEKRTNYYLMIAGLAIIFSVFWFSLRYLTGSLQYRCIPLILLLGIMGSVYKIFSSQELKENLALLTLFLISFMTILRIIFNTTPRAYGFYLLTLGLICYYVFFIRFLPHVTGLFFKGSLRLQKIILICFFAALIIPYWNQSFLCYTLRDLEIKSDKGKIFCLPDGITKNFWEAVNYLRENSRISDKVVVFPEGASINYFSGRDNPLRYYQFFSLAEKDYDKIILELADSNVDYIVIIHRVAAEYGQPFFGVDYGQKLASWVSGNYKIIKQFGAMPFTSNNFGIIILKKKS